MASVTTPLRVPVSASGATSRAGSSQEREDNIDTVNEVSHSSKTPTTSATVPPPAAATSPSRTSRLSLKLKTQIAQVGKAAVALEQVKVSLITHKKGVKPVNYEACKSILGKST